MQNADTYLIVVINFFTTGAFLLYARNTLEKNSEFQSLKKSEKWIVSIIIALVGFFIAQIVSLLFSYQPAQYYINELTKIVNSLSPFISQSAEYIIIFIGLKLIHEISKISKTDNILGRFFRFILSSIDQNDSTDSTKSDGLG